MPRWSMGESRDVQNLRKLEQFERAEQASATNAYRDQRMDFANQKLQFEQAYKLGEAERRAQESATRMQVAQDQLALSRDREDLVSKKAALAEQAALTKAARDTSIIDQATAFLRDARGMDPSKTEFDTQFQNLAAAYPLAFEHPAVKEWGGFHQPLRQKFLDRDLKAAENLKKEDTSELKFLERDRKLWQEELSKAEARRDGAADDNTRKLFDDDIRMYRARRDEAESQLRSFRGGKPAKEAAPAEPVVSGSLSDTEAKQFRVPTRQPFVPLATKTGGEPAVPAQGEDPVAKEFKGYEKVTNNWLSLRDDKKDPKIRALLKEYNETHGETDKFGASISRWLVEEKGFDKETGKAPWETTAQNSNLPVATNPQTGQKLVYRDGKWQPL